DEGCYVLVEQRAAEDLVRSVIPLERNVRLVRAIWIDVWIAALSGERAGIERHARRNVGEVRTGHRARRSQTKDELRTEVAQEIEARQNIRVAAVRRNVREVAERILNLTGATDDVACRCLIGAHKANARVSSPIGEPQIRHRETSGDFFFDGEDFGRSGDSSRAGCVEGVEQNALHAGTID